MIKLLGSICVLAGGGLIRWLQIKERIRRREALADFLCALRRLSEDIRMARDPLPVLLERAAADCGSDAAAFFRTAALAARQGEDVRAVWTAAGNTLPLSSQDRRAISNLEKDLHGDEEDIRKAIALVTYQLAKSTEELDRNQRAEDQRATALCFSAAALLVILLI